MTGDHVIESVTRHDMNGVGIQTERWSGTGDSRPYPWSRSGWDTSTRRVGPWATDSVSATSHSEMSFTQSSPFVCLLTWCVTLHEGSPLCFVSRTVLVNKKEVLCHLWSLLSPSQGHVEKCMSVQDKETRV